MDSIEEELKQSEMDYISSISIETGINLFDLMDNSSCNGCPNNKEGSVCMCTLCNKVIY